jgi:hypothetical protein
MDRLARGLAWKGGAVTVVLLLLLIVLWANLNSMITEYCINRLISEVPSPDGKFKAVVFQRKCSIDTPPSTHVSLLPAAESLPNRKGNVFIAEGSARRAGVSITWKGPLAINLSYKTHRDILRKTGSLLGVTVTFFPADTKPRMKQP